MNSAVSSDFYKYKAIGLWHVKFGKEIGHTHSYKLFIKYSFWVKN
jgi:hypothetical protein